MSVEKITVIDDVNYTAWCYPKQRLIQHEWHQYCMGDSFRKSMTVAFAAFEQYNCDKWLSDDRHFLGAIAPEDWQWCESEFSGRGIWARWKFSAMVMPASALARISLQSLITYFASKGVDARFFSDFDEAATWIRQH